MHRIHGFSGGAFEISEEKTNGFLYFLKEGVRHFARKYLLTQRFEENKDPIHLVKKG